MNKFVQATLLRLFMVSNTHAIFSNISEILKRLHVSLINIVLFVAISVPAHASVWQLMIIPEAAPDQKNSSRTSTSFDQAYLQIAQGLSLSIARGEVALIAEQKVFASCEQYLCGQIDEANTVQKIKRDAQNVQLVILYAYSHDTTTLHVRALDPVSMSLRFADNLAIVGEPSPVALRLLGQDMGRLILAKLASTQPQLEYSLSFNNFLSDELSELTSAVLVNNQNTQLVLRQTVIKYALFDQFLPLSDSEYKLKTSLSASQVEQMMRTFFDDKSVPININFSHQAGVLLKPNDIVNASSSTHAQMTFLVIRAVNPYVPLLIIIVFLLLIFFLLLILVLRRRHLDQRLTKYDKKRNADMWLKTYQKASFPLFGLRGKHAASYAYWQGSQNESNTLSFQAKLYFDAGDINTTKLFVSKALHANAANLKAQKLLQTIQAEEENAQAFSENEVWVRNKLTKAMNNYRLQRPYRALRQLYQALTQAQQDQAQPDQALEKQIKAINRLIKQVSKTMIRPINTLLISCRSPNEDHNQSIFQRILVCNNDTIHIGRLPTTDMQAWISKSDAVFYINHQSVSKVGHHGYIQQQANGFYYIDSHSKNGSFINGELLKPHQPQKLHHNDILQLGGQNQALCVALCIQISSMHSLLQVAFIPKYLTQQEQQTRNRLWPDHDVAHKMQLSVIKKQCWLVYNASTQKMDMCEVGSFCQRDTPTLCNEKPMTDEKVNHNAVEANLHYKLLCCITLGENATITPININPLTNSHKQPLLLLENEALLGEMPLVLPCNLRYGGIEFALNEYDSSSIVRSHVFEVSAKRPPETKSETTSTPNAGNQTQ